jgi:hypothetical protein
MLGAEQACPDEAEALVGPHVFDLMWGKRTAELILPLINLAGSTLPRRRLTLAGRDALM